MDSISNVHTEGMPFYKLFFRCAIFTLVFCVISLLTVLATSLIFYNTENPTSKIHLAGYISLYLSVFLTSFIMTRVNGEKWLFGGLILGAMIFLLTFFLSIFIKDSTNSQNIVLRMIVILVSLISAFLARKRDNKKSKIKRPHHC